MRVDGTYGFLMAMSCVLIAQTASATDKATVAADVGSLDRNTYDQIDGLALEKRVVLRLVQEGFAVVAASEQPDVLVTFQRVPQGLLIEVRGPFETQTQHVPLTGEPLPSLHLEVSQKVVGLIRLGERRQREAREHEVAPQADVSHATAEMPEPPAPEPALERPLEAAAGVGALWRRGGVDVLTQLRFRYALMQRVGLDFVGGLTPSSGPGLTVREWQVQAGMSYRMPLAPALSFNVGALLGALLHEYSLRAPNLSDDSGLAVDLLASLPLALTYWPLPAVGISLGATASAASRAREHTQEGRELWARGAWRADAGLTITARW